MITEASAVAQEEGLYEAEVGGDVVLLSLASGECFGLNRVGSVVWRRITSSPSVSELIDGCCEQFEGDRGAIAADVIALLQDLRERGLLRVTV